MIVLIGYITNKREKIKSLERQKNWLSLSVALLFVMPSAWAAAPNSGTVLDSIKPPAVQQPAGQAPDITVKEQAPVMEERNGIKFLVKQFRFSGELPLPAEELLQQVEKETGQELTLGQLNRLAARLTGYLQQRGYLVAFAYIPAQDIKDGIVEIAVIPGKYGRISINGSARIHEEQVRDMLFCARSGMLISGPELERALLLMNDLAGIRVKATLSPGSTPGTADLFIETADTARIQGVVYADNWGNSYTGKERYGTQVIVNNPGGTGDMLSLGGVTSFRGINDYDVGYSRFIGQDGAKLEVKHSHINYTLGEDFASLGATGTANSQSAQQFSGRYGRGWHRQRQHGQKYRWRHDLERNG